MKYLDKFDQLKLWSDVLDKQSSTSWFLKCKLYIKKRYGFVSKFV